MLQINFRAQSNTLLANNINKDEKYKIKKEILEKHYNKKFESDTKIHNIEVNFAIGLAIVTGILAIVLPKGKKAEACICAGAGTFGAILSPLVKPKKEKYDEAMQKELNEVV